MKNPSKDEKIDKNGYFFPRMRRGGSWDNFDGFARVSFQNWGGFANRNENIGLRIVRNSNEKSK